MFDQDALDTSCRLRFARALKRFRSLYCSESGSRFKQNFVRVTKANIVARALPMLMAPLFTRLYTPADFGALALFSSASALLMSFSGLRFDWSVPNAKSDKEAVSLVVLGSSALLFFSILLFVVLLTCHLQMSFWKGFEVLGWLIEMLPLTVIGAGLYQLLSAWYVRKADLTAVGRTKINQSIAGCSLKSVFGLLNGGALGLVLSTVLSEWTGVATLFKKADGLYDNIKVLSFDSLIITFKCFWRETIASTAVSVLNCASLTATPIVLSQYYSTSEVGWYALMFSCAVMPLSLFTVSLGQGFWSEAAQLARHDKDRLKRLYFDTTRRLLIVSIPVALICLTGPLYVGLLFGEADWSGAGLILSALTPMIVGALVFSPTNHLVVFSKQHYQVCADVMRLAAIILCIHCGAAIGLSISIVVFMISLVSLVSHFALFVVHLLSCY